MVQQKISMHSFVTGLVQGVSFRAATQAQAKQLNLTGWVRNCPNGEVEVFISGPREQVILLQEWLKQGPPSAQVSEVRFAEKSYEPYDDFRILK